MPSAATCAVSHRQLLRRFRRSRRGSAALEFALVAPVFFALLFATIEAGTMFLAGQLLETITQDSARMIQTGQAQTASYTQSQFASYVCSQVPALFTCGGISIDVESYPSFSSIVINNPIDSSGNFQGGNMQYNPGGACDIVVVRLFYQWPLFVTGLGWNPSNLAGNKRLLTATAAFRNEPYSGSACATI
ncbi:TadE/TadG family type IV pilus assembly protein [Bradyrhizobium sp. ARR65]|uniref:TadE/TadG family type IV pilus assembly protein n=1 Tax=Bradyrhizobium sp. ARR65 TaxID=1040989 RepID=UPI000463F3FC|nr:TadE/TadG family type IV pilus assembly protein [Bradyrhizobium sp. ARR65]